MTKYQIYWDNGNNACGTFPYVFDTEDEAIDYAEDWAETMETIDPGPYPEDTGYSYEIIEIETTEDDDNYGWGSAFEQHKAGLNNGRP